jgi:hypothetical protein
MALPEQLRDSRMTFIDFNTDKDSESKAFVALIDGEKVAAHVYRERKDNRIFFRTFDANGKEIHPMTSDENRLKRELKQRENELIEGIGANMLNETARQNLPTQRRKRKIVRKHRIEPRSRNMSR